MQGMAGAKGGVGEQQFTEARELVDSNPEPS
jgi:hypothetical protein